MADEHIEWVYMEHPDIKGVQPARVTKDAFDEVWSKLDKPWKLVEHTEEARAKIALDEVKVKAPTPAEKKGA